MSRIAASNQDSFYYIIWENENHKVSAFNELDSLFRSDEPRTSRIAEIKRTPSHNKVVSLFSILKITVLFLEFRAANLYNRNRVHILVMPNSNSLKNILLDLLFNLIFSSPRIQLYTDGGNSFVSYVRPYIIQRLFNTCNLCYPQIKISTKLFHDNARLFYHSSSLNCIINFKRNTADKINIFRLARVYYNSIMLHIAQQKDNKEFSYTLSFHPRFSLVTSFLVYQWLKFAIRHRQFLLHNKNNSTTYGAAITMPSTIINELHIQTPVLLIASPKLLRNNEPYRAWVNSYIAEGRNISIHKYN